MRTFSILIIISIFFGCVRNNKVPTVNDSANPLLHKISITEVVQTSNYTYLKVKDKDLESWIAVSRMEAAVGDTYYYTKAMEMNNFKSRELDRTFDKIFFVEDLSKQPIDGQPTAVSQMANHGGKVATAQKSDIKIAPIDGGVSIAQLYSGRSNYAGKKAKVRGEVVKVTEAVMDKNWVHLQDGTADGANFDLTVTTNQLPKVGDIIGFEGVVTLNKDFGYGYFYELIIEDASILK